MTVEAIGADGAGESALSPVMQDYLKIIYAANEWSDAPVTTSWLARRLGVAPSSVSNMIGRLTSLELVHHRPYASIELTGEGQQMGKAMVRRHRLIETYLVAELDYRWDQVHAEAEVLEHAISDLMLDRIDAKLGQPTRDPHGDPIPGPDGTVIMPDAVPLTELQAGDSGVVARICDDDPVLLRYLEDLDVHLDCLIRVIEQRPFGSGTQVEIVPPEDGTTGSAKAAAPPIVLGNEALTSIWVVRDPQQAPTRGTEG